MRPFIGLLAAWTLLATGCERSAPVTAADLDRLPDYKRARKAADSGDYSNASVFYNRVVRSVPDAARPHLELGLLYDERLGDPLAALYHYRQFLELDPKSERRQFVEDRIERAQIAFAAKFSQSSVMDSVGLVRLQDENAALRTRIVELEKGVSARPPEAVPAAATPVEPVKARAHVVQKGDTLQSLALRYYGTRAGWEKIYAANRAILPSKDQLKVGQELMIP